MATGIAAAAPWFDIASRKIDLAPVGSISDQTTKANLDAIGTQPLPNNTLQGHGQGIYTDITA